VNDEPQEVAVEKTSVGEMMRDPRVPSMLVLRGLDGSEMPTGNAAAWLEGVRSTERTVVAMSLTAEAIHEEHLREFAWMERDGYTWEQCHNCQRWARYAAAVARRVEP
jgi:hypothetical protein